VNTKIPAAIVGLGRIASLLEDDALREKPCTHAGAITTNGDLALVAGADTDAVRRNLFSEKWNVPVYHDAALMLNETRPAVLHIATHPDSHLHYCELAAAYGVSVVVCEKPLADTLHRARKIAALEKSGRLRVITNHERRYAADYREAEALLRGETLGPLLGVRAVLYMGISQRLRDVLWHDGTHLVDAMMFLTGGTPRHGRRWGSRLAARTGTAWLGGRIERAGAEPVPFVIEAGAGRDHLVFELEFSSARGRLRIGNGIFEVWESAPSPYAEKFRSLTKIREGFPGPTGYFSNMAADAVSCVRESALRPRSSARDGLNVIEYLHAAAGN
jgi:predicted dehydrogenase